MAAAHVAGRHFLQIPGPTNVPDRVLRAIDNPTMDHRGPDFGVLGLEILTNLRAIFQTTGSGDHLPRFRHRRLGGCADQHSSPGDTVLMCRPAGSPICGRRWRNGCSWIRFSWRRTGGAAPTCPALADALAADTAHRIKAVCVVHNETSTGCTSRVDEVRAAMDAAAHPALLLVDTISSLASIDYRHDAGAWMSPSPGRKKG